jgi:hypothetical protein
MAQRELIRQLREAARPPWQLDGATDVCMRCSQTFRFDVRRHHCRLHPWACCHTVTTVTSTSASFLASLALLQVLRASVLPQVHARVQADALSRLHGTRAHVHTVLRR